MSKRFTFDDDAYIHCYADETGQLDWHVAQDIGRSEKSIKERRKKLIDCGAWAALTAIVKAKGDYYTALGLPRYIESSEDI
jgi:hypothetical protein